MAKETPRLIRIESAVANQNFRSARLSADSRHIGVNSISLKTKLGKTNLKIRAALRNDKINEVAAFALQYLIWHVIPGTAFNSKSDFKREDAFSEAGAKHLVGVSKSILEKFFSDVEIETSEYTGVDKLAKLVKQFVDLGFSESEAKAKADETMAQLAAMNKNNQPAVEAAIAE